MEKDKKSKKSNIDKVRDLLDNGSNKDLHPEDEKHLKSLGKRLDSTYKKEKVQYKSTSKTGTDEDYLKPKVKVYSRETKKPLPVKEPEIKKVEVETKEEEVKEELKEISLDGKDLFEVEKIKVEGPEFVEVKPKEVEKEEESNIPIKEGKLSEWEPVDDKEEISRSNDDIIDIEKKAEEPAKEPIKIQETQSIIVHYCSECGSKLIPGHKFCSECGSKIKIHEVEKPKEAEEKESAQTFIPVKAVEEKEKEPEREPAEESSMEEKVEIQNIEQKPDDDLQIFEDKDIDKSAKTEAFKELASIDEDTAVLLYDNGFTSVDSLKIASFKDIAKIKGIKRKMAKTIKKELESKENEQVFDTPAASQSAEVKEDIQEQSAKELDKKDEKWKPLKEEPEEWGPVEKEIPEVKEQEDQEIQEKIEEDLGWEPIDIQEEDNTQKIEPFKELQSIDEKTAILLYDNGYTTIDSLKTAEIKQLTKIKGLKKKTAKKIKKELDEELQKSVDLKPISIEEEPQEEISNEDIKVADEVFEEESKKLNPVELSSKDAEWSAVDEEEIPEIKESEEPGWEPIDIQEEDNTQKIEPFKELQSIDEKTAILLYDNGYTTIDSLKTAEIKQLTKIKGLKKKTAKKIKKELDEDELESGDFLIEEKTVEDEEKVLDEKIKQHTPKNPENIEETIEEGEPEEFFEEDSEKKKIEENIKKHEPKKDEEEFFDETEEVEDIPPITEDVDDAFKDISIVDGKISRLLKENGIDSIQELNKKTIKDLTKIRGIKKKTAKQIKKEVDEIAKRIKDENKSYKRENNPYIAESDDDEWDFLQEDNITKDALDEINEYRHGDYTLYEKEIKTKQGKKQTIRFFSKGKPDDGKPIQLPEGYEVKENKKTGVPYIRKRK